MCTKKDPGDHGQATTLATSAAVLQPFTRSPQKSVKQCSRETGVSRSSVQRILKSAKWKVYIPRLLHAMNEDDTDGRLEYCEWFEGMMRDDKAFAEKVVWSHEAQFKLNGTVNRHNCVYWYSENPHIHLKKPRKYTGTYCVVWFVIPGFDWSILLWRHCYRCTVSRYASDINFTCHPRAVWGRKLLPTTRWRSTTLPSRCQDVSGWNCTWTIDRSKRCCWVSTTVRGSNTSRLLPMGVPKG